MTIAGIALALTIIGYAGLEVARAAVASPWRRG
jgi:hypothetical protein